MLRLRLCRPFGPYPAGAILHFERASFDDVRPGDIVLSGLDDDALFPHEVGDDGGLTPFGCINGQRRHIRYRAVSVTTEIGSH